MIASLIKKIIATKGTVPHHPDTDQAALQALAKGYQIWDASTKTSLQKSTRLESTAMLEKALHQLSAAESIPKTERHTSEKWLQRAFLYLFPPQSSITMGTWLMRL